MGRQHAGHRNHKFPGQQNRGRPQRWGTPTSDALKLTERYTRTDANTIQYEVTIDDPKTYVRPWKVAFPITQEPGYQNFEYACHEGNYAMFDSLSGARAEEKRETR